MTAIVIRMLACLVGTMIGLKLWVWMRFPAKRPCCIFGDDKRFVAIRESTVSEPWRCPACRAKEGPPCHKAGDRYYAARWACRRCPVMGEDYIGSHQDWTIEHEKLVPDVKKWANWSKPL